MLLLIVVIITVVYAGQMIWLRLGLERSDAGSGQNGYEPMVSVIVAARDEEEFIAECLASLLQLEYPRQKLEIIIVNDGSKDRTAEIVGTFAAGHATIKLLNSIPGKNNLRGKTNAVAQGIEISRGEILMLTDADCVVPKEWVSSTVEQFHEGVGIVGGFTLLEAGSAFEGIQSLDWLFLFSLSSAMAGWRMPLTVIGNNLSVRRSAYDATGGFANIPFSVTEDLALVQAVLSRTKYSILFPPERGTLVVSKPCRTLKQLYRQKQRWGVGGLDLVFRGILITAVGWLLRLGILLSIITSGSMIPWVSLAVMIGVDLQFLWKVLRRFDVLRELRYFPFFEIYFSLYVLVLPFVAILSRNVVWKERKL